MPRKVFVCDLCRKEVDNVAEIRGMEVCKECIIGGKHEGRTAKSDSRDTDSASVIVPAIGLALVFGALQVMRDAQAGIPIGDLAFDFLAIRGPVNFAVFYVLSFLFVKFILKKNVRF